MLHTLFYRSPLNFTFDGVSQAAAELERLDDLEARLEREKVGPGVDDDYDRRVEAACSSFEGALFEDLNISGALGALFTLVRQTHSALDRGELPEDSRGKLVTALRRFDSVIAVMEKADDALADDIQALIDRRQAARKAGNYEESDRIRDQIAAMGILLEDTPEGVRWKRKIRRPD